MTSPKLVLLPGLDGTGRLFGPLRAAIRELDPSRRVEAVSFPPDRPLDYPALVELVAGAHPPGERIVLVAESFSGPLAVLLAQRIPDQVAAVVLAATFVSPPVPAASALAPFLRSWAFRGPFFRPSFIRSIVRRLLLDGTASASLVDEVVQSVRSVDPEVLAARSREVLRVDVSDKFRGSRVPMLYLHASRDVLLGRRALREIQRHRPDVPVVAFDTPHLLLQTRAPECAREILAFLAAADTSVARAKPSVPQP
jgi:pimeloyl-[acyl-carrier protein] methyl ester esterase